MPEPKKVIPLKDSETQPAVFLEPCPFCDEKTIYLNAATDKYSASINCPTCLVTMPSEGNDIDELIRCWNGRASKWQPINTAPFRKTVMLCRQNDRFCVAAYRHGPVGGWRHVHSSDQICFEPTHWQDMPDPKKEGA